MLTLGFSYYACLNWQFICTQLLTIYAQETETVSFLNVQRSVKNALCLFLCNDCKYYALHCKVCKTVSMTYGPMNYRQWLDISIKLQHLIQQGTRALYLHLLLKIDLMHPDFFHSSYFLSSMAKVGSYCGAFQAWWP